MILATVRVTGTAKRRNDPTHTGQSLTTPGLTTGDRLPIGIGQPPISLQVALPTIVARDPKGINVPIIASEKISVSG